VRSLRSVERQLIKRSGVRPQTQSQVSADRLGAVPSPLVSWQTAIAIGGVALAPILGFVGIVYGTRSQAKRDREARERELEQERRRWDREDRLERERAARESRAAWADKRFAAHAAFARATRELILWAQGGWGKHKTADGGDLNAAITEFIAKATLVNDTLSELEFFCSPELRKLAEEVNLASREAGARTVTMASIDITEEAVEIWNSRCKAAINERRRYIELAQEEIGLLEARVNRRSESPAAP
jgi:hypothetical protein